MSDPGLHAEMPHLADPDQALQHADGGACLTALLSLALLLVVRHQHLDAWQYTGTAQV